MAVGRTMIVTVAVAPEPESPSVALATPQDSKADPWVVPAVTNAAPADRISVTITPVAMLGPWFVTRIV